MKYSIIVIVLLIFHIVYLTSCTGYKNQNNNVSEDSIIVTSDSEEKIASKSIDNNDDSNSNTDKTLGSNEVDSILNDNESVQNDEDNINLLEEESNNSSELAKDLNSRGYDLYKEGNYEEALLIFKESFETYDDYVYSHYNYACTLGVLMKLDYPTWFSYKDEAIMHLRKVVDLNPDFTENIKADRDLDLLRKEFDYLGVLGYSLDNTEDVKIYLKELNWYLQGPGIIQIIGGLNFSDDGRFSLSYYDLRGFNEGNYDFPIVVFEGNYYVEGNDISFILDEEMLRRRSYTDFNNFEEYDNVKEFQGTISDDKSIEIDIFEYKFTSWYAEFSA